MRTPYQWDESIFERRGLSLTARAWARFSTARVKMNFANDPIKHIKMLKFLVAVVVGAVFGPLVNLLALAIMHLPLAASLVLVPGAAWGAGLVFVALGGGKPDEKEVTHVISQLSPGDVYHLSPPSMMIAGVDQVWALEILSQVLGAKNSARLEQDLMQQTVGHVETNEDQSPARRF